MPIVLKSWHYSKSEISNGFGYTSIFIRSNRSRIYIQRFLVDVI